MTPSAVHLPNLHRCCAAGCPNWIARGYLACAGHWCALPRSDRQLLGDAFRQRETNPVLYATAVTYARTLLGAAR